MKDFLFKGLAFLMVSAVAFFFVMLNVGVYSLFVGALLYVCDYLIGTALFKWNFILLGSVIILFIKTIFGNKKVR